MRLRISIRGRVRSSVNCIGNILCISYVKRNAIDKNECIVYQKKNIYNSHSIYSDHTVGRFRLKTSPFSNICKNGVASGVDMRGICRLRAIDVFAMSASTHQQRFVRCLVEDELVKERDNYGQNIHTAELRYNAYAHNMIISFLCPYLKTYFTIVHKNDSVLQ